MSPIVLKLTDGNIRVEDGNNLEEISNAIEEAKRDTGRPTTEVKPSLVTAPRTNPKVGCTRRPLGPDEAALTKKNYNWAFEEDFYVPEEVYDVFKKYVLDPGVKKEQQWKELFQNYKKEYPELAMELETAINGDLINGWDSELPVYEEGSNLATRSSSGETINGIAKNLPYFFGGSADLAGSNKTTIKGGGDFSSENYEGRNIWFGVREFAMGAILNGMALHGGLRVFGGTFFVFSDYLRPAIRMAALMKLPSLLFLLMTVLRWVRTARPMNRLNNWLL